MSAYWLLLVIPLAMLTCMAGFVTAVRPPRSHGLRLVYRDDRIDVWDAERRVATFYIHNVGDAVTAETYVKAFIKVVAQAKPMPTACDIMPH